MKAITVYEANDGSRWDEQALALTRDALHDRVDAIMAALGDKPIDEGCRFANGEGHVPHNPHTVKAIRLALWEIARERIGKYMAEQEARPGFCGWSECDIGWLSRMIDDGGPICRAASRLLCIDAQGREWGQPYYAMNPDKATSQAPITQYVTAVQP